MVPVVLVEKVELPLITLVPFTVAAYIRQKQTKRVTHVKKQEPSKKKEHRLNAKRFYLTYSEVPENLTAHDILFQLKRKLEFSQHVIGEERNKEGKKHFHAVLLSNKRKDVRTSDTFNIEFEGVECSCHFEKVTNLEDAVRYACKQGKVLSNIENLENGVILSVTDILRKKAREDGIGVALQYYAENYPEEAMGGQEHNASRKVPKAL